jgi:hemolysin-activating ACP:hemolysin acyltransferase
MAITVKKISGVWLALGVAAHLLAKREPFANFRSSDLIRTLSAQIHSGHYLLALDSSTKASDARVVGYLGWALYDHTAAEQFAATGAPPAEGLTEGGDVIWVLTFAAEDRHAFFELTKAARTLYPRHRVMGIRHKAGRKKVMFDQRRERDAKRTSTGTGFPTA